MERDFKGIWIPKEILELGLPQIFRWVQQEYNLNLYAENPIKSDGELY